MVSLFPTFDSFIRFICGRRVESFVEFQFARSVRRFLKGFQQFATDMLKLYQEFLDCNLNGRNEQVLGLQPLLAIGQHLSSTCESVVFSV